jgi:hypothetical protein
LDGVVQGTAGYIAYTAKYAGKKKIRWNSDLRGTEMWKPNGYRCSYAIAKED